VALVEFREVVQRRHMVRTFTSDPVPAETLDRILANAVRGPSAGFSQGQSLLVLTGEDLPKFWEIAGAAVHESAQTAPLPNMLRVHRPRSFRAKGPSTFPGPGQGSIDMFASGQVRPGVPQGGRQRGS
jgi:nitroreductase